VLVADGDDVKALTPVCVAVTACLQGAGGTRRGEVRKLEEASSHQGRREQPQLVTQSTRLGHTTQTRT
jgi:hypothetical protein